jgi:hypothetical protein
MDIRQVVADPEWQALRASFVGTWMKTPVENIEKLREYLGDFSDPLKLRRVHNYLTGTAFRIRLISHPAIDHLLLHVREARGCSAVSTLEKWPNCKVEGCPYKACLSMSSELCYAHSLGCKPVPFEEYMNSPEGKDSIQE